MARVYNKQDKTPQQVIAELEKREHLNIKGACILLGDGDKPMSIRQFRYKVAQCRIAVYCKIGTVHRYLTKDVLILKNELTTYVQS